MVERLPRGLVFKSKTCDKDEAFYTIILKNMSFFPWLNKTADLYKNWGDDSSRLEISNIRIFDIRDYLSYKKNGLMELANNEEILKLGEIIEGWPTKIRTKIFGKRNINLINKMETYLDNFDPFYSSMLQKISDINSLSKGLSGKLGRAFLITNLLHL
jgi:hypothetical protein